MGRVGRAIVHPGVYTICARHKGLDTRGETRGVRGWGSLLTHEGLAKIGMANRGQR